MTPEELKVKNIQLENELDKVIDENVELKKKLNLHHQADQQTPNYKEKYLRLKDKIKGVLYDTFLEDDNR
jgi:DNA-binding transcriptional regulator GbsR (MarR family)